MCTIIHSQYKIDYEVLGSRKTKKGLIKQIQIDCLNHTGSLKFYINISCLSANRHIHLSEDKSNWSNRFDDLILVPSSYWRNGRRFSGAANSIFYASATDKTPTGLKTALDGSIKVEAKAHPRDLDAIKKVKEFPKDHDFFPPLEVE